MMTATKRVTFGVTAAALSLALAGCAGSAGPADSGPGGAHGAKKNAPVAAPKSPVRLIGDGSTAYTGLQPLQPVPHKLKAGEKPPQFVVFSWDGAGEDSQRLFSHFRKVGQKYNAAMTYFLSGVYLLPEERKNLYDPPQHSAGRSDIGFNDVKGIKDTVEQIRGAWFEGNEIGTHFNGHFCGKDGGVGTWSKEEWKSEISQAKSFVKNWKTNAALKSLKPLPFDYEKELVGARTPCLEGRKNFMRAASDLGFRYDTSGVNDQIWPEKQGRLWDLSMQLVPVPGRAFQTLSMDYNFYMNQSGATRGDESQHEYWGDQMRDGLIEAFGRSYRGNRAPLIIGNHFESWNGGTYMRAIEDTIKTVCTQRDVKCVSFRQLADWLDVQDPKVLAKLRTLKVGQAPKTDWATFLDPRSAAHAPAAPAPHAPAAHAPGAAGDAKQAERH